MNKDVTQFLDELQPELSEERPSGDTDDLTVRLDLESRNLTSFLAGKQDKRLSYLTGFERALGRIPLFGSTLQSYAFKTRATKVMAQDYDQRYGCLLNR